MSLDKVQAHELCDTFLDDGIAYNVTYPAKYVTPPFPVAGVRVRYDLAGGKPAALGRLLLRMDADLKTFSEAPL